MKRVILSTILVLLSSKVWADTGNPPVEQDFKCYITFKNNAEIAFYRWKTSEMPLRMANLVGTLRQSNDGKKSYINAVEECVELNASFSSSKAQELDKLTPR